MALIYSFYFDFCRTIALLVQQPIKYPWNLRKTKIPTLAFSKRFITELKLVCKNDTFLRLGNCAVVPPFVPNLFYFISYISFILLSGFMQIRLITRICSSSTFLFLMDQ
jgi:hypothetical protein